MKDRELLEALARKGDENAFNEIVRRHIDLVHSTAHRIIREPEAAADVSQSVFILLTKKAASLPPATILTGWLYQTTRNLSLEQIRKDNRRREMELNAANHQMISNHENPWTRLEPELESAMEKLSDAERDALLLRYFQNRPYREVGRELGIPEGTAQKRVSRALERLRDIFHGRGVKITAATLATAISSSAVKSAPIAIPAAIAAATSGAGLTIAAGTSLGSLFSLKPAVAVLAAVAITGTTTYLVKDHETNRLQEEFHLLQSLNAETAAERNEALQMVQLRDQQIESLQNNVAEIHRLRGETDHLNRELLALESVRADNVLLLQSNAELRKRLREAASVSNDDALKTEPFEDIEGLEEELITRRYPISMPRLQQHMQRMGLPTNARDAADELIRSVYTQTTAGNDPRTNPSGLKLEYLDNNSLVAQGTFEDLQHVESMLNQFDIIE